MANDLAILERQLEPYQKRFAEVLGRTMPVERLMRTILVSVERTPKLLQCDRQSLLNAAMTFAVLGLEVDGATGQGFLVPFAGKVQPIIGYLGYNSLAARGAMTITGRVVRYGDEFDYDEGEGFVRHKRMLGREHARPIIAVWAKASARDRPPAVRVMSLDEIMEVKAKSPRGGEAPWNDPKVGFPAMAEKTAKRRLRRDMPLINGGYHAAARMEEAHEEQGAHAWISPDKGVMIDGAQDAPRNITPTFEQLTSRSPSAGGASPATASPASPQSANPAAPVVGGEAGTAQPLTVKLPYETGNPETTEDDGMTHDRSIFIESMLTEASEQGWPALQTATSELTDREYSVFKYRIGKEFKPRAQAVTKAALAKG